MLQRYPTTNNALSIQLEAAGFEWTGSFGHIARTYRNRTTGEALSVSPVYIGTNEVPLASDMPQRLEWCEWLVSPLNGAAASRIVAPRRAA